MKRFTETDKWNDPWFRKLPGVQKLVFLFLIENCNNAGFYEFDLEHVAYLTGLKSTFVEGALKGLERGIRVAGSWVWVRNFLRHQKNDNLCRENPAHRQIIGLIEQQLERFTDVPDFKSFLPSEEVASKESPSKGLVSPIGKGQVKVQDKAQDRKGSAEGKQSDPAKAKGTKEDVAAYFAELNLPKADGEWFFEKCEGNGWKNGGSPIKDWKATVRSWKAAGYLPSQKAKPTAAPQKGTIEGLKGHRITV